MTYAGDEKRTGKDRRAELPPQHVAIDGWINGAARDIRTAIRLVKGIFASLASVLVAGAIWFTTVNMTNDRQDQKDAEQDAAIVEGARTVGEATALLREHSVEIQALRRDLERIERGD